MTEVENYIIRQKDLYELLLTYIESESDDETDYINLMNFLGANDLDENRKEMLEFLQLLVRILNNHYHNSNFFSNIEKIIITIKDKIKQTLSISEIFNIFQNNKRIILFLLNNNIIELDQYIVNAIFDKTDKNGVKFRHFFYPEIQSFGDEQKKSVIEKEIANFDPDLLDNFEEKRQLGENDSYICSLIRNDSVEDFISYINRLNISLLSTISNSIYEANLYLLKNNPSLIEYAAFFGALQIFQYLQMNNVPLNSQIWFYAIHSNNAELIHILEANKALPNDKSYVQIYKESLKCHHNAIANYIVENYLNDKISKYYTNNLKQNPFGFPFHYHNYSFFPEELDVKYILHYLCLYNYESLVNLFIKTRQIDLNSKLV